ncbi:MAG: hypothetical protein HN763_06875, partial [Opitutales bacterium]|nr:hypothetical protein [Opitutales bacterium]
MLPLLAWLWFIGRVDYDDLTQLKMAGRASKKPTKKRGRPPKNKGLGDTIENITETTGIKKAVKLFSDATGLDCGCDARKEKLNQMFPYRQPTE